MAQCPALRGRLTMPARNPGPDFDLAAMQAHAGDAAQLLKALANERRLQVLCLLAGGERSVGELNALLDLSQSALSQHLAVLREEGLVRTRRKAQPLSDALAPGPAAAVMEPPDGLYCSPAATRRRRACPRPRHAPAPAACGADTRPARKPTENPMSAIDSYTDLTRAVSKNLT